MYHAIMYDQRAPTVSRGCHRIASRKGHIRLARSEAYAVVPRRI